jgi:hypothetical protein
MERVKVWIGPWWIIRTSVMTLATTWKGSSRWWKLPKKSDSNSSCGTEIHLYLHFFDKILVLTWSWCPSVLGFHQWHYLVSHWFDQCYPSWLPFLLSTDMYKGPRNSSRSVNITNIEKFIPTLTMLTKLN